MDKNYTLNENYKIMKSEILARRSFKNRAFKVITRNKWNILLFTLLCIIVILFFSSAVIANKGSFTVSLPREQYINLGLVISSSRDMSHPAAELLAPPVPDMWNISEADLPKDIDEIDGIHNGLNYLAVTTYIQNTGDRDLDYTSNLTLTEVYKHIDEAIRIKIYLNGVPVTYAKPNSFSGAPEPNTIPFIGTVDIVRTELRPIVPGQIDKYTIVAWVEGNDPDCINELMGGYIKMHMTFDAVLRDEINVYSTY